MGRLRTDELALVQCRVGASTRPAEGYALLTLDPEVGIAARPGQFAMIEPPGRGTTLHRPMSILASQGSVEFLVRHVGAGTRALVDLVPGDRVRMIAPLGNGFEPPSPQRTEVLVGGGVGASPLAFHAAAGREAGIRPIMIYGGRSAADLVLLDRVREVANVIVVTEDGSAGERGFATDPLEGLLARGGVHRVLVCGPLPMMAAAARLCDRMAVDCVACLEALMACGFGACLGCAVPGSDGGYLYVCSDGPVVDATAVNWQRLVAMNA